MCGRRGYVLLDSCSFAAEVDMGTGNEAQGCRTSQDVPMVKLVEYCPGKCILSLLLLQSSYMMLKKELLRQSLIVHSSFSDNLTQGPRTDLKKVQAFGIAT